MIEDSLGSRKHVIHYHDTIIPELDEIDEILRTAYRLSSSKQNAFPWQVKVYGPNKERSHRLWELAEYNKIMFDGEVPDEKYIENADLYHIKSAPYTLLCTPRISVPNEFMKLQMEKHDTQYEMGWPSYVKNLRNAASTEIGIFACCVTGAALDRGWDTSYCVCYPGELEYWDDFFELEFTPYLLITIGFGQMYRYQRLSPETAKLDIRPPFEDIIKYV